MPSERLMKHLFLPLLGGVIAAATAASAQTARQPLFLVSAKHQRRICRKPYSYRHACE